VRGLPPAAYAAALALLPGIGPSGLTELLGDHDPEEAWAGVMGGDRRRPASADSGRRTVGWDEAARRTDVGANWEAMVAGGIGVTYLGDADYPAALERDPEPPGVLFWAGDLAVLQRPCVAIVGTRRCTSYGREVAHGIGLGLARAGVCVVSGLALGIDGAAHAGALADVAGTTVGVAASGVDVPYPRRHTALWSQVVARGAVISETPPGRPAQAWRFPSRNRVIAGLARRVVVVESHLGGGSMLTVTAALDRGIDVLAVPGPVTSPASAGCNELLRSCGIPVRHARDVLDELGDFRPWQDGQGRLPGVAPPAVKLDRPARQILSAVGYTPTPVAAVVERTGLAPAALSTTLMKLEGLGLIRGHGGWWERTRSSG
jgi:DNA processing protein